MAVDVRQGGAKLGDMERLDEIHIVVAGPGDAQGLADVHVRSWRESYAGLLPAAYLAQMNPRVHARRWRLQLMAARPTEVVLAAEGRDGLVGYCGGHLTSREGEAEVSTLYLIRPAQKLGLGRQVLGASARVLRSRGARALTLWVLNGNGPARGFYEHLGATAVSERAVRGWGGGLLETAYRWDEIGRLCPSR
jgi:ribosomal protein S18 acetylase RimI-like enzyme